MINDIYEYIIKYRELFISLNLNEMTKKDDLMIELLVKLNQKMDEQSDFNKAVIDKLNEKPLPESIDQDSYINNMEQSMSSMPK